MITIIDYGVGNLFSLSSSLSYLGLENKVSRDPEDLRKADHIILPGVGAYGDAIAKLRGSGMAEPLLDEAKAGKPIMGICLGMQLLGRKSEEGILPGLGLIPFDNIRFRLDNTDLRVPHMGWDIVEFKQDSPLLKNLDGTQRYYFVHSYHAKCDNVENVLMTCDYGYEFAAAVVKDNIMGVQFHPEKSHDFGMALLTNFVKEC